jgi:hypothetical protein
MSDKLDWLNKHLVLLRYTGVKDAVAGENYKIRPDLEPLFEGVSGAEEAAFKLAKAENYKDACELLAYVAHRRAAVWWVYRSVVSLTEELRENPAADRDIADIAKDFEVTVPDFAKVKLPDPPDTSGMDALIADLREKAKEMRKYADPTIMKMVDDAVAVAFKEFEKVHGMGPIEMVKQLGARLSQDRYPIDPASPIFTARAELRAKLQAMRKETIDTIKSVIPPKVPAHEKKVRDNALAAVFRWIAAPDEPNSKACLTIGNECPDTPAGLLALSAFWAFGNLMPGGDQTVSTPPGLAANGLTQTLLMCALHKGGTRKLKERYELYFNLGVDVLSGKDNWDESLADGQAPHETNGQAPPPPLPNGNNGGDNGYKRWKAEEPGL